MEKEAFSDRRMAFSDYSGMYEFQPDPDDRFNTLISRWYAAQKLAILALADPDQLKAANPVLSQLPNLAVNVSDRLQMQNDAVELVAATAELDEVTQAYVRDRITQNYFDFVCQEDRYFSQFSNQRFTITDTTLCVQGIQGKLVGIRADDCVDERRKPKFPLFAEMVQLHTDDKGKTTYRERDLIKIGLQTEAVFMNEVTSEFPFDLS